MEMYEEFVICSPAASPSSDQVEIIVNNSQTEEKVIIKSTKTKSVKPKAPKKEKIPKIKQPKLDKILQKAAKLDKILQKAVMKKKVTKKKTSKDSQIVLIDTSSSSLKSSLSSPNELTWDKSISGDSILDQNLQALFYEDDKCPLLEMLDDKAVLEANQPNSELNSSYFINQGSPPQVSSFASQSQPMWLKIDRIESEVDLDLIEQKDITSPNTDKENQQNDNMQTLLEEINKSDMSSKSTISKSDESSKQNTKFLSTNTESGELTATNTESDELTATNIESDEITATSHDSDDSKALNKDSDEPTSQNMDIDQQTLLEMEYNTRMLGFFDDVEPITSKKTKRFKIRLSGCRKRSRESMESTTSDNKPKKEKKQRLRVYETKVDGPEPKKRRVGALKVKCDNPKKLKKENAEKVLNEQKKLRKSKKALKNAEPSADDLALSELCSEEVLVPSDSKIESESEAQSSNQSSHENASLEHQEALLELEDNQTQSPDPQASSLEAQVAVFEVNDSITQQIKVESPTCSDSSHSFDFQVPQNCDEAIDAPTMSNSLTNNLKDEAKKTEIQDEDFETLIDASQIPKIDIESPKLEEQKSAQPAKPKISSLYLSLQKRRPRPSNKVTKHKPASKATPKSRRSKPFDVTKIHQKFTINPENLELQSCQVKLEDIMSRALSKYDDESKVSLKPIKKPAKLTKKRHSMNDLEGIRPYLIEVSANKAANMSTSNISNVKKNRHCKICEKLYPSAALYEMHMENVHYEELDESVLLE